jgi:outer membrane biosynthesis protein TonB
MKVRKKVKKEGKNESSKKRMKAFTCKFLVWVLLFLFFSFVFLFCKTQQGQIQQQPNQEQTQPDQAQQNQQNQSQQTQNQQNQAQQDQQTQQTQTSQEQTQQQNQQTQQDQSQQTQQDQTQQNQQNQQNQTQQGQVPQAPSNFKVEGIAPDTITLSWSDVQNEEYYSLMATNIYDPDFSKWRNHSASPLTANTTWYQDRPFPEGVSRCYALRACNVNGCSSFVWSCATVPYSLIAECAMYNDVWKVPTCSEGVNNCSTCNLVMSRDNLPSRYEQNQPNSWYSSLCSDGGGGDWYSSRSIERIVLSTTSSSFKVGYPISVTVRVFCSSTADFVHLYFSAGTSPVSWSQAGISPSSSQACTQSNRVEDKTFTFTPSSATLYVIRAVIADSTSLICPSGQYDEVDDIAVKVKSPTYNQDVSPILNSKCVGCHSQLSSYNGVVNGEGTGSCSGRRYVVPGEPNSSLIYLKITNPPCGSKMPPGGSLSQSEIDTIKNWILGGAPEN